jgi:hypothetical protein
MADEKTGQPGQVSTPNTPETPPTPPTPTPPPVQFGGKTPEQLVGELEELKSRISAAEERATRAQHEAEYSKTLLDRLNQGTREPSSAVSELSPEPDDQFFASPGKATLNTATKVFERLMAKERADREAKEAQERDVQARSAFEFGRSQAMRQTPKLYGGIEDEVARAVIDGYNQKRVTMTDLNNPQFWDGTASIIRIMKGERDLNKYYVSTPVPAQPGGVESPSAGLPPQATVTLTDKERAMVKQYGLKEEQYLEMKKADLERENR